MAAFTTPPVTLTNGTTADATKVMQDLNQIVSDGNANVIAKDGAVTFTADQSMGGNRLTNLGQAEATADAVTAGQVQSSSLTLLSSVVGTDTITASSSPSLAGYAAGQTLQFISAGSNTTTTVTLNVNSLGAKSVLRAGGGALFVGDIANGQVVEVYYNGTNFEFTNTQHAAIADRSFFTGQVVQALSIATPAGTVPLDGTTIGNAGSGATSRANADTSALFALLWSGSSNTLLPIQDSAGAATTRGASASADFAALKRMPVPTAIDGQALLAAVSSSPMTASLGALMSHTHGVTDPGHNHAYALAGTPQPQSGSTTNCLTSLVPSATSASVTGISINSAGTGGTSNLAAGIFVKLFVAL